MGKKKEKIKAELEVMRAERMKEQVAKMEEQLEATEVAK